MKTRFWCAIHLWIERVRRRLVWLVAGITLLGLVWAGSLWLQASDAINPSFRLPPVDRIAVDKSERILEAYSRGQLVHTFRQIQLGDAPAGAKQFEGDERTPEGKFLIDYRNPRSKYHLSLHISYPDPAASARAKAAGRSPGGEIFIHGQPNFVTVGRVPGDWTDGCIALSNEEIEALWLAMPDGTPIEIRP